MKRLIVILLCICLNGCGFIVSGVGKFKDLPVNTSKTVDVPNYKTILIFPPGGFCGGQFVLMIIPPFPWFTFNHCDKEFPI
jgi:hypothetical protein